MVGNPQEPVELGIRSLQISRSVPSLASPLFENTVFLLHSHAVTLHIRQKQPSLGPVCAGRRSKSDKLRERFAEVRVLFNAPSLARIFAKRGLRSDRDEPSV